MMYFAAIIIPLIIAIIVFVGLYENKKVYDLFCDGAKEGIKMTLKMFPTLIGIFLAIGMLRSSGLLDFLSGIIANFLKYLNFPSEIIPLAFIKPISGSASLALATDIIAKYGTETRIGMIAATIMAASETTFYVIAIYMNQIKAKKSRNVIIPAIIDDIVSIVTAICIIR